MQCKAYLLGPDSLGPELASVQDEAWGWVKTLQAFASVSVKGLCVNSWTHLGSVSARGCLKSHSLTSLGLIFSINEIRIVVLNPGPSVQFSSVHFSHSVVSNSLRPHGLQRARPSCPSPTPGVYSNSCPLSRWFHPAILSSVVPFSSRLQSFPALGSFQMNQFFPSRGPSIRVSASTSVLPMNTQDWSPLGWTGWISSQSKGLSRVFSNTIVQKHQFFAMQPPLAPAPCWRNNWRNNPGP